VRPKPIIVTILSMESLVKFEVRSTKKMEERVYSDSKTLGISTPRSRISLYSMYERTHSRYPYLSYLVLEAPVGIFVPSS
jgi:hypothetical protein